MDKMISPEVIWPDNIVGLDGSALIPFELGGTLQNTKPVLSVMDLGKMLLGCAREGETIKVRELMSRGAPFTTDWLGTSPLHVAAANNHYETCEVLLRAGICKNARTKVDRTPLHFAVYEGHVQIVELLLNNKCEVDAKDMLKMTPLHWAVEKKNRNIVDLLLKFGADPAIKSKFDKTPISIAIETEQTELFQELISHKMKMSDAEQQQAEENLVYELNRTAREDEQPPVEIMQSNDGDNDMTCSSSPEPCTTNSIFSTNNDDSIISAIDRLNGSNGLHLDDSISKLGNVDDSKTVDTSTLQILKDHGISMLDDTDNTLLNSALQSGRKLVLSDAGKLILNDPKFKRVLPSPINTVSNSATVASTTPQLLHLNATTNNLTPILAINQSAATTTAGSVKLEDIRKKPSILMSTAGGSIVSKPNLPLKTKKVIKILSAEEFKQMCGANNTSTLKKISTDYNGQVKYQAISNSNILTQIKHKKPLFNKLKIGSLASNTKASILNEIKITGIKPIGHHQIQKILPPTSPQSTRNSNSSSTPMETDFDPPFLSRVSHNSQPLLNVSNNQSQSIQLQRTLSFAGASNLINIQSDHSVVQQHAAPAQPIECLPDIDTEKHLLLELKKQMDEMKKQQDEQRKQLELSQKQTDELRKQVDILQKQNEEYEVRLEKLEQEKEFEKIQPRQLQFVDS